jgi:hypothetical protein
VAQEGFHSKKSKKLREVVAQVDLSKAYGMVSWLYLRLMLTHMGFYVPL